MADMHSLESLKTFRRNRIAALLDAHGKVGLSSLVDISADYLWQMGKGKGKSARGVSDANAAKIESALGKPPGWMDADAPAREKDRKSQPLRLNPVMLSEVHRVLRELSTDAGKSFDIERESDAVRFLQVLNLRTQMPAKPSKEEWTRYGARVAAIMAA
jgi:hypothetical protein